jgi:hypothetical protein
MGQVVVRQGPGTSEATPASYFCQGRGRHGQAQRSLGNILPTVRSAQCGFRGSVLRRGIHAATLVTGTVRDELGRPKGNAFSVASVRPHSKHTQTRRVHRAVTGLPCAPRCSPVAKCSSPTQTHSDTEGHEGAQGSRWFTLRTPVLPGGGVFVPHTKRGAEHPASLLRG